MLNCFPKGSYTTGATKPPIIAYGKIEDRFGKVLVSEYHLVY